MPSFSPFVHPEPQGASGQGGKGERFEVRSKLGAGALGVVYRAFDRQRGTEVALKTLREVTGADLYRFKREFRTLADLVHPNLVTLHELHTLGGEWLLTMELVEGVAFVDWVRPQEEEDDFGEEPPTGPGRDPRDAANDRFGATGPTGAVATPTWLASARQRIIAAELRVDRLESAFYQLVDTVHALHQAGKLHRDLKPSNVLVEASGRVVLLDFGLVADVNPTSPELTHTAQAVGTPAYMSPEQAADRALTPASDWFSVGVMLYEGLTGRRPVDVVGRRPADLARLPAPRTFAPHAPEVLDRLCMRLLALDPAARPGGDEILAALGREPSAASRELVRNLTAPPFVGREAELTTLRAALDEVRGGKGVAVFVRGAPGMGKSALLRHFLDEASIAHGTVVLKGRCYERESVPFKTLDAIVDALTTHLVQRPPSELAKLLPRDVAALARLFPVLLRVGAIAAPAQRSFLPPDPVEVRKRGFGALRELLARLGQTQPVVLAIDDVQWGDADSGNFFAELLLHPDAPAMLLVVSHRSEDEDVTPLLAALRRSRDALGGGPLPVPMREITLGPLADAEARQLLGRVHHHEGDWIGQVVRDSGGNPMFLSELARARDEAGSRGGDLDAVGLEEVLAARIGRMSDEARRLLTVCAVASRPLRSHTALTAAGMSGEGSVVTALLSERLLRARQTGAGSELETYHDRIRTVILARLLPSARRQVHASLARALEAFSDRDHEALVDHWLEAGEPRRAATHAAEAARAAEVRLAFHRAADLYGVALAHGGLAGEARRGLEVRLGHALAHAGRLDEAAAAFARAAQGAPPAEELELARLELEQLLRGGKLALGLEKAHHVLAGIGQTLPRSTAGAITSLLAQRLSLLFRRLDHADITPAAAPPSPETTRRIEVLWSVSSGLGFVSPMLGQVLQMRYLREALTTRVPRHLGLALSIEMGYLGIGGTRHAKRIEALRTRAMGIAERTGDRQLYGIAVGSSGLGAFLCGAWRAAAERLAAGEKVLRDECTGAQWLLDLNEHFRISALWYLGETRELVHLMPIYLRGAEERGDAFAQRGLRGWRGNLYWIIIDQPLEARAQVRQVSLPRGPGVPAQLTHYYELLAHTQIDLYQRDGAAAHARVEAIWRDLERAQLLRIQNCFIEAWYLRARAAVALAASVAEGSAERKERLQLAAHAARQIDGKRTAWGAPLATLTRATVARLEGDLPRAETGLRDALAAFEAADMQLFAAVTRRRLAEIVGGWDGTKMRAAADDFMRAQAIANPDAITAMLAPGW